MLVSWLTVGRREKVLIFRITAHDIEGIGFEVNKLDKDKLLTRMEVATKASGSTVGLMVPELTEHPMGK